MAAAISADAGEALVDQVFRLWVNPAIAERGLALTRADVVKALVAFPPHERPVVLINDDVRLQAQVRPGDPLEAARGPVTIADAASLGDLLAPVEIDPNAAWVVLARVGNELIGSFDFRRNLGTAAMLVDRAREFAEIARASLDRGYLGPAIENGFAAAELAVKGEMYLMQDSPSAVHSKRMMWWERWVALGNAPGKLAPLLDRLYAERGAGRYGDAAISMSCDDVQLALEHVAVIIDHAAARCAPHPLLQHRSDGASSTS